MPQLNLNVAPTQVAALSERQQEKKRREWNSRVQEPFAFTPQTEREKGVTVEKSREENQRLGLFASRYRENAILRCTDKKTDIPRRQVYGRKIVGIGYGVGYDSSNWVKHSFEMGLETVWLDVSDVACAQARENLDAQYRDVLPSLSQDIYYVEPVVKRGEIQSVLANPESFALDVGTVEWWYLCRILGCLSRKSATIVLNELGRVSLSAEADPEKKNGIIIVNALKDCNAGITCHTSNLWTKQMILRNLSRGAGRPVGIFFEEKHRYFEKEVSAFTMRAA